MPKSAIIRATKYESRAQLEFNFHYFWGGPLGGIYSLQRGHPRVVFHENQNYMCR
ncbi:hypothetical protein SLEP1_g27626 [Rubroshorea leprosula]|uniref:Uncharacterized protein n=1 Tax=Rubroshorea leprosula TaxID=152421 RepID=A0AAV5JY34_9ROSI|nr:hypothetical protein SLEP1_g27626 [Rubroshorea leprosula]